MMRIPAARTLGLSTAALRQNAVAQVLRPAFAVQQQARSAHAVSNPTLANIEKRWESMPPQEQAELWMALRDRMTVDWNEMTTQEKKACESLFHTRVPGAQNRSTGQCCVEVRLRARQRKWSYLLTHLFNSAYWIAFGPHGPRALPDPQEKWEIMKIILYCLAGSAAIFGTIRYFANPPPKTMTKEWQEATNEYLKVSANNQGARCSPWSLQDITVNTEPTANFSLQNSRKRRKQLLVCLRRATTALAWCRASLARRTPRRRRSRLLPNLSKHNTCQPLPRNCGCREGAGGLSIF